MFGVKGILECPNISSLVIIGGSIIGVSLPGDSWSFIGPSSIVVVLWDI